MGYRYHKSVKILPGVKINLNKKSTSITFGGKGFHHTISSTGKNTTTVGIPGTGLSYSKTSKSGSAISPVHHEKPLKKPFSGFPVFCVIFGSALILYGLSFFLFPVDIYVWDDVLSFCGFGSLLLLVGLFVVRSRKRKNRAS